MGPAQAHGPRRLAGVLVAAREVALAEHAACGDAALIRDLVPDEKAPIAGVADHEPALEDRHPIAPVEAVGRRTCAPAIGLGGGKIRLSQHHIGGLVVGLDGPRPQEHAVVPGIRHGEHAIGEGDPRRHVERRGARGAASIAPLTLGVLLADEDIGRCVVVLRRMAPDEQPMVARIGNDEGAVGAGHGRTAGAEKARARGPHGSRQAIGRARGAEHAGGSLRHEQLPGHGGGRPRCGGRARVAHEGYTHDGDSFSRYSQLLPILPSAPDTPKCSRYSQVLPILPSALQTCLRLLGVVAIPRCDCVAPERADAWFVCPAPERAHVCLPSR